MIIYVWIVCLLFMGFEVAGEAMGAVAPDQGRNGSCITTESSREPAPSDGISTKK